MCVSLDYFIKEQVPIETTVVQFEVDPNNPNPVGAYFSVCYLNPITKWPELSKISVSADISICTITKFNSLNSAPLLVAYTSNSFRILVETFALRYDNIL